MTNLNDTPSAGPLTAADLDRQRTAAPPPARHAACVNDRCQQGRMHCPTQAECSPAADAGRFEAATGLVVAVAITAAGIALSMLLAQLFRV